MKTSQNTTSSVRLLNWTWKQIWCFCHPFSKLDCFKHNKTMEKTCKQLLENMFSNVTEYFYIVIGIFI